ncbi:TEA/ATTS domain family-domain-containing protein [Chiua virens]|nr:TEA/ATTS domain family-domain-containing protein [Chiua virens]
MESLELEDIKPTIPSDDIPDNSDEAIPAALGVGKLKQTRYEDVWPEDVHAAFMEAVALYPPMGKRRLKYYRLPTHENENLAAANRTKSFGRCQLIQSYILEKTGKSRSRKQVSSHLQRLKKIHKDNPAMCALFLERHQPSPDHRHDQCSTAVVSSPDVFANMISFNTHHLKSEFDLSIDLRNTDASGDASGTFSNGSEVPYLSSNSALDLSTKFHDQTPVFFPQDFLSPQYTANHTHASDGDGFSESQDQLSFKESINGGFRVGSTVNTSAFSISMRRLASRPPIQDRQFELGPTTHCSHVVHSPTYQSTHQWISHDGSMDDISYNPSYAPAQQALHMPFHPLQLIPTEKQRLETGFGSDWMLPHDPDIPLGIREDAFGEVRIRYPQLPYHYNPTCPVNSPVTYGSPSESEVPRLSRGLAYPYATASPITTSDSETESATIFPEHALRLRESPEIFASPLLIKPTPLYPISYIHPKVYSDHTPTRGLPS